MVSIYCKAHHSQQTGIPCDYCQAFLVYATARLTRCPFGEKKTTCGNCLIHCYNKTMKKQVKEIMRYSGPRMLLAHPFLALLHIIDGWRKSPGQNGENRII